MYYTHVADITVKISIDGCKSISISIGNDFCTVLSFLQIQHSVPRDWVNDYMYLHYITMFMQYLYL